MLLPILDEIYFFFWRFKILFYLSFDSIRRRKRLRSEFTEPSGVSLKSNDSIRLPNNFREGPVTNEPMLVVKTFTNLL